MRELNVIEIKEVKGGVDQSTAIGGNLGIIAIGVGILAAGATAPIWFGAAMIGVSISLTTSYFLEH
ncbi:MULTISPECIES: hypothetical protein [unclassified Pseudoalteromonas]|uniref:hypothetical protein n=1 Tax=unclassified Pseudoalteromonas TaxID=194690 RepID=UPI000CF6935F|nr:MULTISPECIES: hypothetical protein [unclassified Pseudoalteromonas]TMO22728.1 hypothetical protein CWC28_20725 [Pseudoalteromonas sp. S4492]